MSVDRRPRKGKRPRCPHCGAGNTKILSIGACSNAIYECSKCTETFEVDAKNE